MDSVTVARVARTHLSGDEFQAYTAQPDEQSAAHPHDQIENEKILSIPKSLMNSLVTLVTNGTVDATLIVIGMFLSVAIIVVLIFEKTAISDIIVNRDLTAALSLPTVTIAFIYRGWQDAALKSYIRMPAIYYDMLRKVGDIADDLAEYTMSESEVLSKKTVGGASATAIRNAAALDDRLIFCNFALLLYLNSILHRMFTGRNTHAKDRVSDMLLDYLEEFSALPNGSGERFDLILGLLQRSVKRCESHCIFYPETTGLAQSAVATLRDLRTRASAAKIVTTPPVFETHQYIVVFVYLVFLLPIQMYQQVDLLTMFTYPVVMVLFMGPFLLTFYIGGPFSVNSKYKGMDFGLWHSTNMYRIRTALRRSEFHRRSREEVLSSIERF